MGKNKIFSIKREISGDRKWELISLNKLSPPIYDDEILSETEFSFTSEIKTAFMLGSFTYDAIVVEIGLMQVYGEQEDSAAFRFTIGDRSIDSHGVMRSSSATAIPLDRNGKAITISEPLPEEFFEWIEHIQSVSTWD